MKLSAALAIQGDIRFCLRVAFIPTLKDVFHSPSLLFSPSALSSVIMAHVWNAFAGFIDEGSKSEKEALIPKNAYGRVLDIGAGHGHTAKYLDRSKVTQYIALEPNVRMHTRIRKLANSLGYEEDAGSLLILGCGAEDVSAILSSIDGQVDTMISILTLCTIPSPRETIRGLVQDVLKPGGQLLFYEHVKSPHKDVASWQDFWSPVWSKVCGGCRLNVPSHVWIQDLGIKGEDNNDGLWKSGDVWGKQDEPEQHLFWHRVGKYVKA